MERVLAIGTHIDDIEIGLGGSLLNFNNSSIIIAIIHSDDSRAGSISERLVEQQQANLITNPEKYFLFSQNDKIEDIIGTLDQLKISSIYYMWDKDYHQNHKLSSTVGRALGRRYTCNLFAYGSCTSYDFNPNYLVPINWNRKLNLIKCFKSQLDRQPKYLEIIKSRDRYYGSLLPKKNQYAEGFIIERLIGS